MRFVEPLSPKAGDDLDGLLRAFFRRQMPHPWPAPPVPPDHSTVLRRPASGYGQLRSRWALAAAVALLLLGSLLLPRRFAAENKSETGLGGLHTADKNIFSPRSKPHESKPAANKNKPDFGVEKGDLLPELDDSDLLFPK
jgi:hypothetical protein